MKTVLIILLSSVSFLASAQSYTVGGLTVAIGGRDENFQREVKVMPVEAGVQELEISLTGLQQAMPKPVVLTFKLPSVDIQSYLAPYGANATREPTSLYQYSISRMIPVSFAAKPVFTSATMDQPAVSFLNTASRNRFTLAASELVYPVTFRIGENEDGGVGFDVRVGLFEYPARAMSSYQVKLRFDTRDIQYNVAQRDLLQWWKTGGNLTFAPVPQKAHLPFYCTWYALKSAGVNTVNVERQAAEAKALGCETIIVDDGWQKSRQATGGYCLYNGDWEVDKERFADFRSHVRKVQAMGLQYMLWVGPSMVGEQSKAWELLKDKMLYKADWASAWVVDPRFPEVRRYLAGRLVTLMKESGINGFKIDFMDLINTRYASAGTPTGGGRDYESVEEAVVRLLADIYQGCKAINPDVLIEYRQFYTNPVLQQYANMFRAVDCPNDLMENRTRTLDIRNLNAQVVHADPLAWNQTEQPEHAALQLLHTFLSVPQVSADLTQIDAGQKKMLQFLLKQWTEFNEVLTRGKAFNYGPDAQYSWSEVSLNNQTAVVAYLPVVLSPQVINRSAIIVNGTHEDNLVLDLQKDFGLRNVSVFTCSGELVRKEKVRFNGLLKIKVPGSGIIRVDQ